MKIIVNTAVVVPVNTLPLTDDTDFKTIEGSVAYNASGLALQWNFVTTAGVTTQTAVTPTTSGDYDWSHLDGGMYKIEIPASGGASINNSATGYGYFTGSATGVLPFRGPTIEFVPANVANSVVNGTDLLQVDVTRVNGADQTIATQSSVDDVQTVVDQIAGSTVAATGTVQDLSATTTVFKTSLTQADDFWNDATITFTSGALAGQTKPILGYVQTNGVITLDEPLTSAPSNGVTFQINTVHVHPVSQIQEGLATSTNVSDLQTHGDSEWATATGFSTLDAAGVRSAVGMSTANLDTQFSLVATAANLATLAGKFTGITLLAKWLGLLAGKAADTATRAEINATTAGVGYNETTDSQQAIADNQSATTPPTVQQIVDGVLDEQLSAHADAGSVGAGISSAQAAGDPLSSEVPGAYPEGTAGFALGEVAAVRVLGPIGSTVTNPGEVTEGQRITAYHHAPVEAGPFVITDEDGDPVDMSSYSTNLAFVVYSVSQGVETVIAQINYPSVLVGGDDSNQVTISDASTLTATVGRFRYCIRRRTTGAKFVRAQGEFIVSPAANVT